MSKRESFRLPPSLVPLELLEMKIECPSCGKACLVEWTQPLAFPKQPVASNDGTGHWVPVSFPVCCNAATCEKEFQVHVPRQPVKGSLTLYGDEADRHLSNSRFTTATESLNFSCVSLVGVDGDSHDVVRKAIEQLKLDLRPEKDPRGWAHHFSDIWSGNAKRGQFSIESKAEKIKYAHAFASVIRNSRPGLVTMVFFSCIRLSGNKKDRARQQRVQHQDLYFQAILSSLMETRRRQHRIQWMFDHLKDASKGPRIEGWASECFLGLQYTPLFLWLSAGATVERPQFVKPGSTFQLEIADFICFWTAREFSMLAKNLPSELPTSCFGKGFYQGTRSDGNAQYLWGNGTPLNEIFNLHRIPT